MKRWGKLNPARFELNRYLFQTKNPDRIAQDKRIRNMLYRLKNTIITTTIETNRITPEMGNSPTPTNRADAMNYLSQYFETFITIEPIMDFDVYDFAKLLQKSKPTQVNIGADTGGNKLPEPTNNKVKVLITELNLFTEIHNKKNLKRLLT